MEIWTLSMNSGAVIINENLEIIDSFKRYVSPQFGFLDEYIKKLTGIKYKYIKNDHHLKK